MALARALAHDTMALPPCGLPGARSLMTLQKDGEGSRVSFRQLDPVILNDLTHTVEFPVGKPRAGQGGVGSKVQQTGRTPGRPGTAAAQPPLRTQEAQLGEAAALGVGTEAEARMGNRAAAAAQRLPNSRRDMGAGRARTSKPCCLR